MVSLTEFIAEIETDLSNYAETNDIDRISIKTWVIDRLRKFGKNICDRREGVFRIENSRVLLPETFKSLHLALKLEDFDKHTDNITDPIFFKQYIENPAIFDDVSGEYIVNYCDTKIITEKLFVNREQKEYNYLIQPLSLVKGIKGDSIDAQCLNLHPSIRDSYPDKISITNRTLNTNFRAGKVYIQYNSLPVNEEGELVIPVISTGDILNYLENYVKIKIAENLIVNNKNASGLLQILPLWKQQDRQMYINAKSEANWSGLSPKWHLDYYRQTQKQISRFNLPQRNAK